VYASTAIVSTLSMSISSRKGNINQLRRIGALPRQVVAVHLIEAAVVVTSGVALAGLASLGTLLAALWNAGSSQTAGSISIPWLSSGAIAIGEMSLTLAASLVAVLIVMRKAGSGTSRSAE
jgi:ABC-type lipoprotein release transport system permease subunit